MTTNGTPTTNGLRTSTPSFQKKDIAASAVDRSNQNQSVNKIGNAKDGPAAANGASNPAVDSTKKEPKKGSFAEIMARAKTNQSAAQSIGTISHKAKDKTTLSVKRELKLTKQALKDKKLGTSKGGTQTSSAGSSGPNSPKFPRSGKESLKTQGPPKKPRPQPTYRGTMRQPSTTAAPKPKGRYHEGQKPRRNEYVGTDEELDEDDYGDEQDDYESDVSDDMEAGFDDVEDEEASALKEARKEDEREAALESQLKREKEEKKRRLQMLAKKAKPQRY